MITQILKQITQIRRHCEATKSPKQSQKVEPKMKMLSKTTWFRAGAMLVACTFFFQANVYALKYHQVDIMPEDDFDKALTGFAVSVAMPFVPGVGEGLQTTYNLSNTARMAIEVGMAAGLGATPGIVSGDNTSAWIGGAAAGFSAYSGFNTRMDAVNKASTDLYIKAAYDLPTRTSLVNELGTEGYFQFVDKLATLPAIGQLGVVGTQLAGMSTQAVNAGLGDYAAKLTAYGNMINPSMQQYASKLAIGITTHQVGTTLAKAGTLCWGMNPEWAQFTGMVGASTVGSTMGAMTPQGQGMMQDMYKDLHPTLAKWASPKAGTWENLKVGAITGAGLGAVQAGINIGIDSALDGKVPDSTRMHLASLGGEALGAIAWSGIVGGLGENALKAEKFKELKQAEEKLRQAMPEVAVTGETGLTSAGLRRYTSAARNFDPEDFNVSSSGDIPNKPLVQSEAGDFFASYKEYEDYVKRGGQTPDGQGFGPLSWDGYKEEVLQPAIFNQIIDADLTEYAKTHQDLLAAEGQLYDAADAPRFAREYNGFWGGIASVVNDAQFRKNLIQQGMSIGISWAAEDSGMKPQYASILGSSGSMLLANMEIWPGGRRLREPTAITPNENLDAILEPGIYGALSLAMTNLSKDKTGADLIMYNLGTMHASALAHAGLATVLNKQGLEELKQGYRYKIDAEFYPNLLSFGTDVFGAKTTGRREELVGGSTIYGATQRNDQIWNFAGLGNFAYADRIRQQGGDWRLQMSQALPSSPFVAMADQAGSLARYYTIRNMEGLSYTGIKSVKPYYLGRLDKVLTKDLADKNPEGLRVINEKVQQSLYPARVTLPQLEEGKIQKFIYFPGFKVGFDDQFEPIFENTVVGKGIKYRGTEAFSRVNINRPYELPVTLAVVLPSKLEITPPNKAEMAATPKILPDRPVRERVPSYEDYLKSDKIYGDVSEFTYYQKAIEDQLLKEGWISRLDFAPQVPEETTFLKPEQVTVSPSSEQPDIYEVAKMAQQWLEDPELAAMAEGSAGADVGAFPGGGGGTFRGKGFTGSWKEDEVALAKAKELASQQRSELRQSPIQQLRAQADIEELLSEAQQDLAQGNLSQARHNYSEAKDLAQGINLPPNLNQFLIDIGSQTRDVGTADPNERYEPIMQPLGYQSFPQRQPKTHSINFGDIVRLDADKAKVAKLNEGLIGLAPEQRKEYIKQHAEEYKEAGAISIFAGGGHGEALADKPPGLDTNVNYFRANNLDKVEYSGKLRGAILAAQKYPENASVGVDDIARHTYQIYRSPKPDQDIIPSGTVVEISPGAFATAKHVMKYEDKDFNINVEPNDVINLRGDLFIVDDIVHATDSSDASAFTVSNRPYPAKDRMRYLKPGDSIPIIPLKSISSDGEKAIFYSRDIQFHGYNLKGGIHKEQTWKDNSSDELGSTHAPFPGQSGSGLYVQDLYGKVGLCGIVSKGTEAVSDGKPVVVGLSTFIDSATLEKPLSELRSNDIFSVNSPWSSPYSNTIMLKMFGFKREIPLKKDTLDNHTLAPGSTRDTKGYFLFNNRTLIEPMFK